MKFVLLLAALMLSACVKTIDAPSLLPRAAEREDVDAPSAVAMPPVAADVTQAALIAKLLNQAKDGDAAFLRALPAAATHAAPQSEAWIVAQNARSAADVARGPTLDALAALDTAIGDAIDKGQDTTALAATRTEVQAIYNGQTARLAELTR
jgi:hypothetical protein